MTIENQIKAFISNNLIYSNNGFPCGDEESLLDQGIINSVGIMQLVLFVEKNFNVSVDDWEITPMNFDTVARLAGYVRAKMKAVNFDWRYQADFLFNFTNLLRKLCIINPPNLLNLLTPTRLF